MISAALTAMALLVALPARAADDTPHGRVLVCYGMSYGVVELLFAAGENLDQVVTAVKKDEAFDVLRGLGRSGTKLHSRTLALLKELEGCLRAAMNSAEPDETAVAVISTMAGELDSASDATEDFIDMYGRNKKDIDGTAYMLKDSDLLDYAAFPRNVKAALDRLEPLFLKVGERSQ